MGGPLNNSYNKIPPQLSRVETTSLNETGLNNSTATGITDEQKDNIAFVAKQALGETDKNTNPQALKAMKDLGLTTKSQVRELTNPDKITDKTITPGQAATISNVATSIKTNLKEIENETTIAKAEPPEAKVSDAIIVGNNKVESNNAWGAFGVEVVADAGAFSEVSGEINPETIGQTSASNINGIEIANAKGNLQALGFTPVTDKAEVNSISGALIGIAGEGEVS